MIFQIFVLTLQTEKIPKIAPFSGAKKITAMKDRIKEIQNMTKMSQQDFAKQIGVAPGSLSSIYSGRTQPTNNYVIGIHKAFPDINVNWLMFGEGGMYDKPTDDNSSTPSLDNGSENNSLFDTPDQEDRSLFDDSSQMEDVLPFQNIRRVPEPRGRRVVESQQPLNAAHFQTKEFDKVSRQVKEIRVFYDDGTYESFIPSK